LTVALAHAGTAAATRTCTFVGSATGQWTVTSMRTLAGEPLPMATAVSLHADGALPDCDASWRLRGLTSHERYVTREEKERLVARQPPLGRAEATCAALIPLRKNAVWWALAQDERRRLLEDRSSHIATGQRYLPAVARRLYHCRDLGERQPFDFLTWFEIAPADAPAFDRLLAALRASEEWAYVDRDVEIRLTRGDAVALGGGV
jgi:hypothetical protein